MKTSEFNGEFKAQRLDLIYLSTPQSNVVGLAAAVAGFAVFSWQGLSWGLAVWLATVCSAAALRHCAYRLYVRSKSLHPIEYWWRIMLVIAIVHGFAWGLISLHRLDATYRIVAMAFPLTAAVGALNSYGIILTTYCLFWGAMVGSLSVGEVWFNGVSSSSSLLSAAVVAIVLFAIGKSFEKRTISRCALQVGLQQQNAELAESNKLLLEREEISEQQEQLASQVFASLTAGSSTSIAGVQSWSQPKSRLGGDLIQVVRGPIGQTIVFLGDFVGHGFSAALGAIPTAFIFRAMAQKGCGVEEIAAELRVKLSEILPVGYFCSAAIVEVSPASDELMVLNAGLPPIVIRRAADGVIFEAESANIPLGGGSGNSFSAHCSRYSLSPGDSVYLYSDGLSEAQNQVGEQWGRSRVAEFLGDDSAAVTRLPKLQEHVKSYIHGTPQHDDISVVELVMPLAAPTPSATIMAERRQTRALTAVTKNREGNIVEPNDISNPPASVVPICSYCKAVRDESNHWHKLEVYLRDQMNSKVTHGICPGCAQEFFKS